MTDVRRDADGVKQLRRERAVASTFALLSSLALAHFVNERWYMVLPQPVPLSAPPAILHAPEAYRVAMPALVDFLTRHLTHGYQSYSYALTDLVFSTGCLYGLARLAVYGLPLRSAGHLLRLLVTALFFAFAQFPLSWVVPWQRPETMPSACFLAVAGWCAARGSAGRGSKDVRWTALLLAAALWQGFVRADVAVVFGLALFLAGALEWRHDRRSTTQLLQQGAIAAVAAASVQLYLQRIRLPGLHYAPGTPVFMLRNNLLPHNLSTALLAVLPLGLGVAPLLCGLKRRGRRMQTLDRILLLASALYAVLWGTVAILDEVRVYVPFLCCLCVVAARATAAWLLDAASPEAASAMTES